MPGSANSRRGFTMAELLVVVAIIAVLAAVALPVFSGQLEKSRESVDAANIRSQYAQVMNETITASGDVNIGGATFGKIVLTQTQDAWQNSALEESIGSLFAKVVGSPAKAAQAWVEYSGGKTTLRFSTAGTDPYSIDNHNDPNVKYTDGKDNLTFSKIIMSNKASLLQEVLRTKLGDPDLSVSIKNLGDSQLAAELAQVFANGSSPTLYDKVLTVKGSAGTYQYYYKKTSDKEATLYAIRLITDADNIAYNRVTESDTDGWVAYTGPLNPAGV